MRGEVTVWLHDELLKVTEEEEGDGGGGGRRRGGGERRAEAVRVKLAHCDVPYGPRILVIDHITQHVVCCQQQPTLY